MALTSLLPVRSVKKQAERVGGVCCVALHADRVQLLRCDLDTSGQPAHIRQWVTQAVEAGRAEETLAALLQGLKKPWQDRWTLLLPPSLCTLGTIELPPLPPAEVRAALAWRLAEVIGAPASGEVVSAENYTFDVLPHPLNKAGADLASYWVWAVANTVLRPWLVAFKKLKLPEPVVDCTDLAQRNLAARVEADGRALALLSQGPEGFLLTIVQAGKLLLTRRFETRLSEVDRSAGLASGLQWERIALEVQRSLDMFDRKYAQVGVGRLLLAPQKSLQEALGLFRSNLYVPVDTLAPEVGMALPEGVDDLQCWGPLGAVWRDFSWTRP